MAGPVAPTRRWTSSASRSRSWKRPTSAGTRPRSIASAACCCAAGDDGGCAARARPSLHGGAATEREAVGVARGLRSRRPACTRRGASAEAACSSGPIVAAFEPDAGIPDLARAQTLAAGQGVPHERRRAAQGAAMPWRASRRPCAPGQSVGKPPRAAVPVDRTTLPARATAAGESALSRPAHHVAAAAACWPCRAAVAHTAAIRLGGGAALRRRRRGAAAARRVPRSVRRRDRPPQRRRRARHAVHARRRRWRRRTTRQANIVMQAFTPARTSRRW